MVLKFFYINNQLAQQVKLVTLALTEGISRALTETIIRGHISALRETVIRERFAAQNANLTVEQIYLSYFY